MNKSLIIFICSLLLNTALFAQTNPDLIAKIKHAKQDTNLVNLQLQLADRYIQKRGEDPKDLDSARIFINQALTLSKEKGYAEHEQQAWLFKGRLYAEAQDYRSADSIFSISAKHYQTLGDKPNEAAVWRLFGDLLSWDNVPYHSKRLECYNKAYRLYLASNRKYEAAMALKSIADAELNLEHFDTAEQQLRTVIGQLKALNNIKVYEAYYLLGQTYVRKNELKKQLLSMIECVNGYDADPSRQVLDGNLYYFTLAVAYYNDKQFEKALIFSKKSFELAILMDDHLKYFMCLHQIILCYTDLGRYKEGLAFLKQAAKKYRVRNDEEERIFLSSQLSLYNFLNANGQAEKIIPAFRLVFDKAYLKARHDGDFFSVNKFYKLYAPLPIYYLQTRQWDNLALELKKIHELPLKSFTIYKQITINELQYKLDSAKTNYLAALKGFQHNQLIKDSLNNAVVNRQINDLEASYRSAKKDKAIESLKRQSVVRESKLSQVDRERKLTIGGILATFALAAGMYFAFRNKQRSNRVLRIKQQEINGQNAALSVLVDEKEKLLTDKDDLLKQQADLLSDKEWLLKEVHHRVKNNLQIVMSLLYTQSAYLKNNAAIEALKDSQNRVHAISIIHQKLYSKVNVATVGLAEYISDLVSYLRSAFDTDKSRIRFKQDVETISLDIAQAVPVGLVINEAVTNCIKYAFSNIGGDIVIEGRLIGQEMVLLSITDNGRGLPNGFDITKTSSLGMEMMKALSKQLDGTFDITNDAGVMITIQFMIDNSVKMMNEQQHQLS